MVRRLREEWDEQTNSIVRKWVRGPSTLPKVFKQPRGSKLQLIWDDDNNPVGPDTHPNLFSESMGVLMAKARLYDWRKRWEEQEETSQDHLWTELKKVWELDESRKEVTLGRIANNEFKNKKCKWKKTHYARHSTYEQRIIDKPEQLTAQEWVSLVEFWDTRAHTVVAERNKANRAKQVGKHATGRISFSQLRNQIVQEKGAPPNLGDFYVRTRTSSRTDDIVDEASRAYIDKMRDIAGTDEDGNQQPLTDEVYMQVMPPHRHKRKRLMGPRSTAAEANRVSYLNELQNELVEMRNKEEERRAEIDEMKRKACEKDEERQREMDDMKRQFQERLETMEDRVMQKLLENMPITRMLSAAL
ncbi:hypothetical protein ACHQM5_011698 [Ranunculus cassubicifolius]